MHLVDSTLFTNMGVQVEEALMMYFFDTFPLINNEKNRFLGGQSYYSFKWVDNIPVISTFYDNY